MYRSCLPSPVVTHLLSFKKCQHGDANLIWLQERFDKKLRGVFNPLQYILIEDGKAGSPHMRILPCFNGRLEGAVCNFMPLYRKVLAPLNSSQQLLSKAQLFVLSWQLPLPPLMATVLFSQNWTGLEVNSGVIWSFLQL